MKRKLRFRWIAALGVLLLVGGCQWPAVPTDALSPVWASGGANIQTFVEDFVRQLLAAWAM